jgi:hypothetical protein
MSRFCALDSSRATKVGPFLARFFFVFAVVGAPSPTAAGVPFLTDDPEPVEYGHWEVIGFSMATMVQGDSAGILPGIEINYGALPNVQLHVKMPVAFNSQGAAGTQFVMATPNSA